MSRIKKQNKSGKQKDLVIDPKQLGGLSQPEFLRKLHEEIRVSNDKNLAVIHNEQSTIMQVQRAVKGLNKNRQVVRFSNKMKSEKNQLKEALRLKKEEEALKSSKTKPQKLGV